MSPKIDVYTDKKPSVRFQAEPHLDPSRSRTRLVIANVHLARSDPEEEKKLWDVAIEKGFVQTIQIATPHISRRLSLLNWIPGLPQSVIDAKGEGLLLPSLCHAHIHLDKCFLLDQCGPLDTGSFDEAMKVTANAKAHFSTNPNDLYERGKRLILDSLAAGVTTIRAHVEVDKTVRFACLDAATRLKKDFARLCDIQICVFAQDPLSPPDGNFQILSENATLLVEAARRGAVSAIGSAPYVEPTRKGSLANIEFILDLARQGDAENDLLVDFHLDYNLSESTAPMVYDVLAAMRAVNWDANGPRVTLGHCTRWSLFPPQEWARLKDAIGDLPVSLVALPQSDVYMMRTPERRRGTVDVHTAASAGVDVALGVNNVGNAFTPQGSADPLELVPLGVALYQDATPPALRRLLRCVSTSARGAIAFPSPRTQEEPIRRVDSGEDDLLVREGDVADLILLPECASVRAAALDPSFSRVTIRSGCIVARREASVEFAHSWQGLTPRPVASRRILLGAGVLLGVVISWLGVVALAGWVVLAIVLVVSLRALFPMLR
ncbi:Metallo-dependent hydrolase [Peniophora sp. CONT]|nr:Metallo-dependent hydrolase [Peniophora sp. CONT]